MVTAGLTSRSSGNIPYYEWYHAEAKNELPVGDYHVEAMISLTEYKEDKSETKTVTDVGSTWFDADLVPLILDPPPPKEDYSLKVHGRVSGQSMAGDYDGVLDGATVSVFTENGKMVASNTTNANGYYKFDKLGPGKYTYRVGAPRGSDYEDDEGRGFELPKQTSQVYVYDVVLARPVPEPPKPPEPPGEISGQVLVDLDGERFPVPGADVYVQREGKRNPIKVMTGENGQYSVSVPKGSWRVAAVEPESGENQVHPNRLIIGSGSNKQADFVFKIMPPPLPVTDIVILTRVERGPSEQGGEPVISLKGSGSDESPPLEIEYLGVNPNSSELFREQGMEMAFEEGWHWYAAFPTTDLPPGNYQAKATLDGYVEGVSLVRTALADYVTFLDVSLEKIRPEIDVYVISHDEQPIGEASLSFINTTIGKSFSNAQKGSTDSRGRFMTELTDGLGAYNVMASAAGFVGWGKAVNVDTNRISVEIQLFPKDVSPTIDFTGIVVTCGGFDEEEPATNAVDTLMSSAPADASYMDGLSNVDRLARLQAGTDKRVPNARVRVKPEDPGANLPQLSQPFTTDSMGQIKIPDLPVGSYNVDVTAENHIAFSSAFTVSRQVTDPTIFALEPRNLEFENWIRKILTTGDGWQNKKSSTYYHSEGIKEEPDDCRLDYALALSHFNISWASSTTSFANAVHKEKDDIFWDRAVEGNIWMLMAQRQGSKVAAFIQQIATSHYGGAAPTEANLQTAFVMGKAIGVLKGPWSENNPASLRAYSQNDQTISASLQGQILAEYKRGKDTISGKASEITDNAKTQADELKRIADMEKAKKESEIAGQIADINQQITDGIRQLEILDNGFNTYERDAQAQINDLNRQIQTLIARLNTLVPTQPMVQQQMTPVPCQGCAAEIGRFNPECPYCQQANANRGGSDMMMDRNTQLRNLLIEQQRQQVIGEINTLKARMSTIQSAYDRERRNWMNQRNIILSNDKRLRARYTQLSGERSNIPNFDNKIDDITKEANKEKTDFKTYCPYPLEERRQELLNWVNRKTDTVTNQPRRPQTVASLSPAVTKPLPVPKNTVANMPKPATPTPVTTTKSPNGMETTASGLEYDITSPGYGKQASNGKYIKVHFKGTLDNGIVFANSKDQKRAHEFKLGSTKVIPGLNEGIAMLKEGGKAKLRIPPKLAYGFQGSKGIPSNATVTYEVEVIKVSDSPTQQPPPATPAANTQYANFRSNSALNTPLNSRSPDKASVQLAIALVTNEIRKRNGRTELAISSPLANAAQMHAEDMKTYDFFSHNNPKDHAKFDPARRAQMHGIANPNISENINQGFSIKYNPGASVRPLGGGKFADLQGRRLTNHTPLSLADALLKTWMESSGHKANILDPSAVEIGCGIAFFSDPGFHNMPSVYAVQKFQLGQAVKAGSSTPPLSRSSNTTTSNRGIIPSQTNRYNPGNTNSNTNSRRRVLPGGSNSIFEVFGF
ncbi:MAG: carboxypeptidase regulatory-like domain-containing protein [Verrucomicrobiales bacterium]|nr:carboxypeptidase regulatory-like domain-containing protein [Verrucomicrobiales bacterium]